MQSLQASRLPSASHAAPRSGGVRARCAVPQALASPAVASSSASASAGQPPAARQSWIPPQLQRRGPVAQRRTLARSTALEPARAAVADDEEDMGLSAFAAAAVQYAIELARVSETYEVHSWMILLGLLRQEQSAAVAVLKDLGLDDVYGAWHEVLWALHAVDGLQRRSFVPEIKFANRAYHILNGSQNFARWHGKDKVSTEDLLLALAAGGVLEGLFPDLPMTFDKVLKAVERRTGPYDLPDRKRSDDKLTKSTDEEVFL